MAKVKPAEGFSITDMTACSYCSHLVTGLYGEGQVCTQEESPFYKMGKFDVIGAYLQSTQRLLGCEHIKHNGKKIPSDVLTFIPSESYLWKLLKNPKKAPDIVEDYEKGMCIEPIITMDELTGGNEGSAFVLNALARGMDDFNVMLFPDAWRITWKPFDPDGYRKGYSRGD